MAMSTTSTQTDDKSKQIDLTNSSGVNVAVLLPTVANAPDSPNNIEVYDQDLEVLQTTDGKCSLAEGAKGTYLLDQTYIDPKTKKPTYSTIYDLLVSTSDWFSPLANIGVIQNFFADSPSYTPVTATSDEAAAIKNAGVFIQTIAAYPTSKLTKDYQTAMSSAQTTGAQKADGSTGSSDAVANTMTASVNTFFKGTKSFQNVTLAGVVAMQTYYRAFPFVWAQYTDTTYYLYSSDGKTTSFVGTIALSKPTTIDVTQPNGGYTCSFAPATDPTDTTKLDVDTSKSKSLTFQNGLFVDDVSSDIPQIAVRGTFQIKRTFTQKPADTQVLTVLSGTIDGQVCLGFDKPQKKDDKANSEFWNSLFHPKNSAEIFKSVMTIGGAVMMLFFFGQILFGIVKWARGLGAAKEPTTKDLLERFSDDLKKSIKDEVNDAIKKQSGGEEQAPDDPADAQAQIDSEAGAVQDNLNAGNLEDGLQAQADSVQTLAQYESDMDAGQLNQLQQSATDIQNSNTALDNATPDTLNGVVQSETTNMGNIQTEVGNLSSDLSSSISSEQSADIAANDSLTTEAAQDVSDSESNASEDAAADDPEAGEPVFPE